MPANFVPTKVVPTFHKVVPQSLQKKVEFRFVSRAAQIFHKSLELFVSEIAGQRGSSGDRPDSFSRYHQVQCVRCSLPCATFRLRFDSFLINLVPVFSLGQSFSRRNTLCPKYALPGS